MKLATTLIILALVSFSPTSLSLAQEEEPAQHLTIVLPDSEEAKPSQPATPERMPSPPAIKAKSALLVDAVNGQVLYERNAHVRRPMASTTKIMTAILVLENCGLGGEVVASKKACETPHSSLNLKLGERLTMRDLMHGILIRSANDASVVAGEKVGGTLPKFISMMNARAKELGARNTNFVNTHGLHNPSHYSTAHDLSLMARHAVKYPVFNEIVKTPKVTIKRSINQKDVVIVNQSKFLKNYPGADGIKSGFTSQSGRCYVGSATRDGWRLISVVLDSPNVSEETAALMDYGFKNFKAQPLASEKKVIQLARVKGGAGTAPLEVASTLQAIVPRTGKHTASLDVKLDDIIAPVQKGQRLGTATALVDGKPVQSVALLAASDVDKSVAVRAFPWARDGFILLIGMIVSVRYGAAAAKGVGVGGSRLAQEMRRVNRRG